MRSNRLAVKHPRIVWPVSAVIAEEWLQVWGCMVLKDETQWRGQSIINILPFPLLQGSPDGA